jgi:hypothetical protein
MDHYKIIFLYCPCVSELSDIGMYHTGIHMTEKKICFMGQTEVRLGVFKISVVILWN